MGWWSTNREGVSLLSESEVVDGIEMVWGDGPADILGAAIDKIDKEFLQEWGRPTTTDELIAAMRFSYARVWALGKNGNVVRRGSDPHQAVLAAEEGSRFP